MMNFNYLIRIGPGLTCFLKRIGLTELVTVQIMSVLSHASSIVSHFVHSTWEDFLMDIFQY